MMGVDPNVALAVAKVESNYNPRAIGSVGEIGLFQVRPEYVKGFSREDLMNPYINIFVGITKIKEAKNACGRIGNSVDYLVCYNLGVTGARRIKRPKKFSYMKKIYKYYGMQKLGNN